MEEDIVVEICMGSSCFSRGNGKTLQTIQKYFKEHLMEINIVLRGNHCFANCSRGPVVKIGETIYEHVNTENILELLEATFNHKHE